MVEINPFQNKIYDEPCAGEALSSGTDTTTKSRGKGGSEKHMTVSPPSEKWRKPILRGPEERKFTWAVLYADWKNAGLLSRLWHVCTGDCGARGGHRFRLSRESEASSRCPGLPKCTHNMAQSVTTGQFIFKFTSWSPEHGRRTRKRRAVVRALTARGKLTVRWSCFC